MTKILLILLPVLTLSAYGLGLVKGAANKQDEWNKAEMTRQQTATEELAAAAKEMVKTYQQTTELLGDLENDPSPVPLSTISTLDGMRKRQELNGNIYTYPSSPDTKND